MSRPARHFGMGQTSAAGGLLSKIGSDVVNVLGPMPAINFWDYLTSEPSGTTAADVLANAMGKPITQNETNLITAQNQQAIVQACGPGNADTPECQEAAQQAAQDINAAAQQSNQELAGFPYTGYEAAAGAVGAVTTAVSSISGWFWVALGAAGLIVLYEVL
jgi:hypothetical protein